MTEVHGDCAAWLEDKSGMRLPLRGACSLGRSVSNNVRLADEKVSRRHALIHAQMENEFWLVDFGSRNGTYLNDQRIVQPTRLKTGDRLRMGSQLFVFHQGECPPLTTRTTIAAEPTAVDIRPARCWLLVADIIDSTRLTRELAPDELPQVTGRWVAECQQAIEGAGGRINQFMGDGFFACWHDHEQIENHIERALQSLRQLQDQARPAFRFAVHLGQVTIGGASVGEEERISGSDVHLVFRMESLAGELGEMRILSAVASQRLQALLATREIGSHSLAGFDERMPFSTF